MKIRVSSVVLYGAAPLTEKHVMHYNFFSNQGHFVLLCKGYTAPVQNLVVSIITILLFVFF